MAADHRKSLNGLVGGSRLAPTLLFIASLAFGLIEPTGKATAQPSQNEIRASSWTFGHKLSLAVSANFLFGVEQSEKYFNEAQAIGRELGVQVKPLAPKPQSIADGLLKLIEYFTDGDGADIRSLILSRHGDYNAALYTFAVRISQLPVLYRVNPEMGDKIAEFVRVNSTKI